MLRKRQLTISFALAAMVCLLTHNDLCAQTMTITGSAFNTNGTAISGQNVRITVNNSNGLEMIRTTVPATNFSFSCPLTNLVASDKSVVIIIERIHPTTMVIGPATRTIRGNLAIASSTLALGDVTVPLPLP